MVYETKNKIKQKKNETEKNSSENKTFTTMKSQISNEISVFIFKWKKDFVFCRFFFVSLFLFSISFCAHIWNTCLIPEFYYVQHYPTF